MEVLMSRRKLLLLPVVGLILAACTSGGSGGVGSAALPSSTAPLGTPTRVAVNLSDALKMEPATISVPSGVAVTFVVTNAGATDHEFYLGDETAQAKHEDDMQMGGMMDEDADGISLKPGETKELSHTFAQAGQILAGCHVAGHYTAGMKATITVTE